jgi:hypothetical protein
MHTRRQLLAAAAGSLLIPVAGNARGNQATDQRRALDAAVEAFFAGWATGNWKAFLDRCDDAMTFQFPVGEQRGRHVSPRGKQALVAWTEAHRAQGNRITESLVDLKLFADDWVVVCDRGSGVIGGAPYTGLHALFMRAGPSGRLVEFREYFGELPA